MINSSSKPNPETSFDSATPDAPTPLADGLGAPSARSFPPRPDLIPDAVLSAGSYRLRFAKSEAELDELLRLRFRVFNLELGEGLASSYVTGRDEDEFDRACHHLVVDHVPSGEVVGTYRLQTAAEMAPVNGVGLYTASEYVLDRLPDDILAQGIELGRACIAQEHRKRPVLFLLWRGLALYVAHNRKRYLFGCCSITSQDPRDGWRARAQLEHGGHVREDLAIGVQPGFECEGSALDEELAPIELPPLFDMYLRFGGKICGPPVIDRAFGTIDFFLLFDVLAMDEKSRRLFFDGLPTKEA